MVDKLRIQDIARLAGVSVSTVSRVLNKKPDVDPATRDRILQIMKEHNFVPNHAAISLAGGHTRILGVIVPSLSWPFIPEVAANIRGVIIPTIAWQIIPEIMRGVTDTAHKTQYELLLYSIHRQQDHSEIIQRILATQLISGLLAVLPGSAAKDLLTLHERDLPVVLVDDQGKALPMPWVGTNNRQGAYTAVHHLTSLGHRRIGHIRGLYECSQERYLGYLDALLEADIMPDPALVVQGDFGFASGYHQAQHLFQLAEPPSAIFAGNDQMAYGVVSAAAEHNLCVPEDIAIVGFDDIPFSEHIKPALTTIRQPFFDMGKSATELLISLVEAHNTASNPLAGHTMLTSQPHNEPSLRLELSTELIVRESCGTLSASRPTPTTEKLR
ncbi:MAG TPA: LacI family DNA-binding transcriptional regulator [Ktedonobacteraceae bacterium]|jgi:LacI family transcriptional regulator|nr:LacI family DNA-binding transcriptional regulator [Ktedonobacteraceae bacterium]